MVGLSRLLPAGLAVALVAVAGCGPTGVTPESSAHGDQSSSPRATATPRSDGSTVVFGTLDTSTSSVPVERSAGIRGAMIELSWAAAEPSQGVFDTSYLDSVRRVEDGLAAQGQQLTLGLGLQYAPAWAEQGPDAQLVDQTGRLSGNANLVFNQSLRTAAADYLSAAAEALDLSRFAYVRLTGGSDAEVLYPSTGSYWAFDSDARNGPGRPPSLAPDPYPDWIPGSLGLSQGQIARWVDWYVGALANVVDWEREVIDGLGFTGTFQLLTPGSGVRPDGLARVEKEGLPEGLLGTGAAWDLFYQHFAGQPRVMAYVTSVADGSGGNNDCESTDHSVPLDSPLADGWSATRWISRVAAEDGLATGGENPGYSPASTLTASYTDEGSTGMAAAAVGQAVSCGFRVFYWAHDADLFDGHLPLAVYADAISSASAT